MIAGHPEAGPPGRRKLASSHQRLAGAQADRSALLAGIRIVCGEITGHLKVRTNLALQVANQSVAFSNPLAPDLRVGPPDLEDRVEDDMPVAPGPEESAEAAPKPKRTRRKKPDVDAESVEAPVEKAAEPIPAEKPKRSRRKSSTSSRRSS